MLRRSKNHVVRVSFIEQNPLALQLLLSILRKDPSAQVIRNEDLSGLSKGEAASAVIVVDNCGLPLPLSECLRRLRVHFADAKYVLLDQERAREDLVRLLSLGIDGFLPFGEVRSSLLPAVHSVAKGNIWVPREVLREYVQQGRKSTQADPSGPERMTSREKQILELVKRRLSNKEIGDILGIRESTVKFHLSNIYSKCRAGNRLELIGAGPDLSPSWPLSFGLAHSRSNT